MNTGKKKRIFLEIMIVLLAFLGILLWKGQKTKTIILSAVLPKEYKQEEKAWIEGIKTCSKDQNFQVNFFFEEDQEAVSRRIEEEKGRKSSGILTKEDFNKNAPDLFLEGYRTAEKTAKEGRPVREKEQDQTIKVGIAIYNGKDQFVRNMTEVLEQNLKESGQKKNVQVLVGVEDAEGDSQKQDSQLDYLIEQNCDFLIVNAVDTWSTSRIIHKAQKAEVPLIFFNREPTDEDIFLWDQAYYVGTNGKELGKMQGELLTEAFQEGNGEADKNGDGIIQYILVEGEEGHIDLVRRTDAILNQVNETFPMEEIGSISAEWDRNQAEHRFLMLDPLLIESCEAVICNNDDMALGVIDALEKRRILDYPVILGIDGTGEALKAIETGQLYGTVSQKTQEQVEKMLELIWDFGQENVQNEVQKIYTSGEKHKKTIK